MSHRAITLAKLPADPEGTGDLFYERAMARGAAYRKAYSLADQADYLAWVDKDALADAHRLDEEAHMWRELAEWLGEWCSRHVGDTARFLD